MARLPRKGLPLYCRACGTIQNTGDEDDHLRNEPVDHCWKCKKKDFTPSLSALSWTAALGTHSGNKRFLRSLRISSA